MKKTLLFIALTVMTFATNSCSKDNSSDIVNGSITMKVDGVYKTFTKIHLQQTKSPDGNDTSLAIYTEDDGNDYGDVIAMTIMKGVYSDLAPLNYWIDEEKYDRTTGFVMHITSNGNDKKLVGTFSGDVSNSSVNLTITEGTFNIQY